MKRILFGVFVVLILILIDWYVITRFHNQPPPQPAPLPSSESSPAKPADDAVSLSPEKSRIAGIETAPVERRSMQPRNIVPGRLRYDEDAHIAVKIPTASILTEVRASPGDSVDKGTILALVTSPEVGTARADVLMRREEFKLAVQKAEWERAACAGLEQLVGLIKQRKDPQTISNELGELQLGDYREQLISAYSRDLLADSLAAAVESTSGSGALAGRAIQERIRERDAAQSALQSAIEQSRYESRQACVSANAAAEDAERRLKIARQHLQSLLGYDEPLESTHDGKSLSLVKVQAPFSGTIEQRNFSKWERVESGAPLFVLADTSRLWVAADLREHEWEAIQLEQGQEILVSLAGEENKPLTAKVVYVGRAVDPATNAVPLIASLRNRDGLLRPGQFAWVDVPLGKSREVIAVPSSAVVEHEGQPFVFVEDAPLRFRRVEIKLGLQQRDFVEILSGLCEQDRVVVQGAFALKSELLLEKEED